MIDSWGDDFGNGGEEHPGGGYAFVDCLMCIVVNLCCVLVCHAIEDVV